MSLLGLGDSLLRDLFVVAWSGLRLLDEREPTLSLLLLRLRPSAGEELLDEHSDSLPSIASSAAPTHGAVLATSGFFVGDGGFDSLPGGPLSWEAVPVESTESDD